MTAAKMTGKGSSRGAAGKRHVALLRGINVGRAKRVAMADLKAIVEGLGYGEVRTLLNSGNVVFTARGKTVRDAASGIEKTLAARLGVSSRVTVLSGEELAAIVEENPLLGIARDHSRLLVSVLRDRADRVLLEPLAKQSWKPDALALGARAAYVWCPGGTLESRLADTVLRALGDAVTTRNWSTILKIHALTT